MKRLDKCEVENCIPTLSSCVEWNGGDIEYLGVCDGDSLNTLLWEVITKLQEIAGEDLSAFDLDALLDICDQRAPNEVTLLNILNVIKANQICLKDFIDTLSEQLAELLNNQNVNVNLKCYAEFDNLGNSLSITRDQLDQLVIDNLCNHKLRIETLEGKVISLQSQIDNLDLTPDPTEANVATCVDAVVKPVSSQVVAVAEAHCDLEDATGDPGDIASALANTPGDLNAEFGLITGWILAPANWAENYNNLLLEVENLRQRINTIEDTCCALTCDDIELGFTAVFNEDNDGIIIKFTAGAGSNIPAGLEDKGSRVFITDKNGVSVEAPIDIIDNYFNNNETEVGISGLDLSGPLTVDITAKIGNDVLICEKCLKKTVQTNAGCAFCTICNDGDSGVVVVTFSSATQLTVGGTTIVNNTTTTSTTTTTTAAP
jgi:hypothetical protein